MEGASRVAVGGDETTRYRYSASGQRYWKRTRAQAAEYYALDGLGSGRAVTAGVFSETASTWDWNVLSPGGEVLGRQPHNDNKRYYVKDHLGTVRAAVTAAGAIVEARDYDAWGVLLAGRAYVSGAGAKEGYTGHERDGETGLDYAGARYYLSAYGRWNGADPLADLYSGWSPYNYVLNNPLGLVDPDGMAPENCCRRFTAMARGAGRAVANEVRETVAMASNPGQTLRDIGSGLAAIVDDPGGAAQAVSTAVREEISRGQNGAEEVRAEVAMGIALGIASPARAVRAGRAASTARTYQTYTKRHANGRVYTGRTSGEGSPLENVQRRDRRHHMNEQGFGPAELDRSSTSREAIRGREQIMIDHHGGAQSQGGTSGNAINGISPMNPNRSHYLNEARKLE